MKSAKTKKHVCKRGVGSRSRLVDLGRLERLIAAKYPEIEWHIKNEYTRRIAVGWCPTIAPETQQRVFTTGRASPTTLKKIESHFGVKEGGLIYRPSTPLAPGNHAANIIRSECVKLLLSPEFDAHEVVNGEIQNRNLKDDFADVVDSVGRQMDVDPTDAVGAFNKLSKDGFVILKTDGIYVFDPPAWEIDWMKKTRVKLELESIEESIDICSQMPLLFETMEQELDAAITEGDRCLSRGNACARCDLSFHAAFGLSSAFQRNRLEGMVQNSGFQTYRTWRCLQKSVHDAFIRPNDAYRLAIYPFNKWMIDTLRPIRKQIKKRHRYHAGELERLVKNHANGSFERVQHEITTLTERLRDKASS